MRRRRKRPGARDLEIRDTRDVPVRALRGLLASAEWAAKRATRDVARCIERTTVLLTGWHRGRCVAMVRILSDGVFRALIDDLVVHPAGRGRGWGRRLVEAALAHPLLRDVEEVALSTVIPDFYKRWGFRRDPHAMKRRRGGPGVE